MTAIFYILILMDIFSHGLWAGVAAKVVNKKLKIKQNVKPLNFWLSAFWGVFPDLFAFTISFIWLIYGFITGSVHLGDFPRPEEVEPAQRDTLAVFRLSSQLYNYSHSLIVFFSVIAIIVLIRKFAISRNSTPLQILPLEMGGPPKISFVGEEKRAKLTQLLPLIPLEMGGWLLHIITDIPTHSYRFYPTPFLWPISGWKFNGFSWGTPWFMILNYSTLLLIYAILKKRVDVPAVDKK